MSWLSNFVRPKIRALTSRDVPENLWVKCPACSQMIFHRELDANQKVCTHCGHHMRIGARDRLTALFDDGAFTEIEPPQAVVDPLRFRDRKRYTERLREAQAKAGSSNADAMIVAHGTMGGMPTVVAVFDFAFMGGSMGIAVGESIVAAARLAVLQEAPLIVIPASGGARMQEGILSLMQMPRTIVAIDEVKEAGLPYVVLLTDPTTGGVSASFAMLGDIQIAEPGAQIGFAGKRVIEDTIREQLPDEFQTAEYLLDHGMLDMVVPRQQLRDSLIKLFAHLMRPKPPAEVITLPTGERKAPATAPAKTEAAPAPAPTDAAD
ncbi:MAG: acetyl-CoA carboxylase, carboxyltransferase subunit beta [Bauldia litoralis]